MATIEPWQLLLFFAGLLSAWGVLIIATTRWTVNRGLAANDQRVAQLERDVAKNTEESLQRERELLQLRCDLPLQYVRRDDAIRQETVINAKMDALAAKIDALRAETIRGNRDDAQR